MKNRVLVFFLFLSLFSFNNYGQFELSDLVQLRAMDHEAFELFILNKGFDFKEAKVDHECRYVHYVKHTGSSKRYICLEEGSSSNTHMSHRLNYQSSSPQELESLLEAMVSTGYERTSSMKDTYEDRPGESLVFEKGDIELWLFKWEDRLN
jgi:hypothetical protein